MQEEHQSQKRIVLTVLQRVVKLRVARRPLALQHLPPAVLDSFRLVILLQGAVVQV